MTDATEWQGRVGETWAQEWRRTDRSFAQLTERLLQEQRGVPFTDVLDIGCGAGEVSLAIARNHPKAWVTGIDISSDLISAARDRSGHLTNAEFLLANAAVWRPDPERRPQLLVSRHGVMFFDEPVEAFANLKAAAAPGAKLAFSCFRKAYENGWVTALAEMFPSSPPRSDAYEPGPFAFGDKARVEMILQQAGWTGVQIEPFDYAMIFGSGERAIEDALSYFGRIGPVARLLAEVESSSDKEAILARMRHLAEQNFIDGLVAMPASAWIVTATA